MIWLYKFCQPSLILLSMTNISRVEHDRITLSRPRIAKVLFKKNKVKAFPVGPMVMTPCFQCMSAGDASLIPGWGTKTTHATWCSQKKLKNKKKRKNKVSQY